MKNKNRKYFLIIGGILLLLFIIIIWQLIGPTVNAPKEKYFYIKTGSTYNNIKEELIEQNIISGAFWFDKLSNYLGYNKNIKPGKYKINEGMSVVNLVRMLRSGNQSPVNLVITKLRTKEDLAKKLGNNFEFDSLSAIQFLSTNDSLVAYNLDSNTVMTAVIPNTYTISWNNTPGKIFKKLFAEQQRFWNDKRMSQAKALGFSTKEIYTLASIVEEETNKAEDKGKIASVYINRMRTGMKLAADPTVKFGIKDFTLKRIYQKHTRMPSPYNTYLVYGLPPGPICTPSVKTIDAVLNAPATDYIFFVASPDFSGYSNFATNYQDHLKFAKAYQNALDTAAVRRAQKQKLQ